MTSTTKYPEYVAPTLTVDAVVFQIINSKLHVLLVKRARDPFEGAMALPGGYNPKGCTTLQVFDSVLKSKTGLDTHSLKLVEQLYTFDTVARDPRGHAVSVTYMGLGYNLDIIDSKETHSPRFIAVDALPNLAYDHENIIKFAHQKLKSLISSTNAVYALLPSLFTLTQLQSAYEAALGRSLDKRNFRKKFLSLNLIAATDKKFQEGAHRPAILYTFSQQTLHEISRSFE